jgi:hypothetical protein
VDQQRVELVQLDALLPSVRQGVDLVVGGEARLAEAAEQPHHRQVGLAVPTVGRGVDDPRAAVHIGEHVAAPQVAVDPRRRLVRAGELGDPTAGALDVGRAASGKAAAVDSGPDEGQDPALHVERGPAGDRAVRLRQGADEPVRLLFPPERRRACEVERGEATSEVLVGRYAPRPDLDALGRQPIAVERQDRRHAGPVGDREPAQSSGLVRERRGLSPLHPVAHQPCSARNDSSRPRHAASIWS